MSSIEEKLWNYIDGNCSAEERQAIARLIEHDAVYQKKYNELLQLNNEFAAMDIDEPPMAFTYNVMEAIRAENSRQPLKARINGRIIWAIAAFFIVTIAALLIYIISTVNWSAGGAIKVPVQINITKVNSIFSGATVKGFLFFDVVLGLFLLDKYLRHQGITKEQ